MPVEDCPNCGAEVPAGARACPECGSDKSTGWSQTAYCDGLGIPDPDEEFHYDDFVRNEFGRTDKKSARQIIIWALWAIVSVAIILVLLGAFQ